MDTEHIEQPTAEELAAEQADSTLPTEDEVRSKLAEELGLDPEDEADKEVLDKVTTREMDGRKKLSDTIRAKINYRNAAQKKTPQQKPSPSEKKDEDKDLSTDDVLALVGAQITHPDDIKELKRSAKLLETTVAGALNDDLVMDRIKKQQEKRASAQASDPGGKRAPKGGASDQEVLEKSRQGVIPKPGTPEAEALFRARRGVGKK